MIILCGKTASGKNSIRDILLKHGKQALVTYTTRPMRAGEAQGETYHFISNEDFLAKIDSGFFTEWTSYTVASGDTWYYGSHFSEDVPENTVAILNPHGVKAIKDTNALIVYLDVCEEELRRRLAKRGDDPAEAERRLEADRRDFKDILSDPAVIKIGNEEPAEETANQILQIERSKSMHYSDVISNVHIFGLENAIAGSKYPMAVDVSKVTDEITPRVESLATSPVGAAHDNFMNGIIVQFDLTFTNKAWVEAERYHFLDFISSQSTMHRITKFDLNKAYNEYVDPRIVEIMKEKVKEYNKLLAANKADERLPEKYLEILYSNPAGFKLTAKMTTNYRQLKTIYRQRKTHRLPEWRAFCAWCETLPHSNWITGEGA